MCMYMIVYVYFAPLLREEVKDFFVLQCIYVYVLFICVKYVKFYRRVKVKSSSYNNAETDFLTSQSLK